MIPKKNREPLTKNSTAVSRRHLRYGPKMSRISCYIIPPPPPSRGVGFFRPGRGGHGGHGHEGGGSGGRDRSQGEPNKKGATNVPWTFFDTYPTVFTISRGIMHGIPKQIS